MVDGVEEEESSDCELQSKDWEREVIFAQWEHEVDEGACEYGKEVGGEEGVL